MNQRSIHYELQNNHQQDIFPAFREVLITVLNMRSSSWDGFAPCKKMSDTFVECWVLLYSLPNIDFGNFILSMIVTTSFLKSFSQCRCIRANFVSDHAAIGGFTGEHVRTHLTRQLHRCIHRWHHTSGGGWRSATRRYSGSRRVGVLIVDNAGHSFPLDFGVSISASLKYVTVLMNVMDTLGLMRLLTLLCVVTKLHVTKRYGL